MTELRYDHKHEQTQYVSTSQIWQCFNATTLCLIIHVYIATVYGFANATVHNSALLQHDINTVWLYAAT